MAYKPILLQYPRYAPVAHLESKKVKSSFFCQMATSVLRTNFILREDILHGARKHMTAMKEKQSVTPISTTEKVF